MGSNDNTGSDNPHFYDFSEEDIGTDRSHAPDVPIDDQPSVPVHRGRVSRHSSGLRNTEKSETVRPSSGTVVQLYANRENERDSALEKSIKRHGISVHMVEADVYKAGEDHAGWRWTSADSISTGFVSSKSGPHSEDSEPLFVACESTSGKNYLLGAFDGMGGAGASASSGSENTFTEAYRASRLTRRIVTMECVPELAQSARSPSGTSFSTEDLAANVMTSLKKFAGNLDVGTSRIRGTLTKTLPTTLACAEVRVRSGAAGGQVNVRAFWAGDSRVWVMTPSDGLQQISRDDVSIDDPLEQLRQDPPLNNMVSASAEFTLNENVVSVSSPCVVLCATDGVSGYVRSPGEVELLLLRAMQSTVRSGVPLGKTMWEIFGSVARDDSSAVVLAVGFRDERQIFEAFSGRLHDLEKRYAALDSLTDPEERSAAIGRVWADEARLYCARMPRGGGGGIAR